MVSDSIMAAIGGRYGHSDHLALRSGERSRAVHQLAVQIIMQPDYAAVNTVNPENVVMIGNAVLRWNGPGRLVRNESHALM